MTGSGYQASSSLPFKAFMQGENPPPLHQRFPMRHVIKQTVMAVRMAVRDKADFGSKGHKRGGLVR
jgi:hypothetical protein